MPERLAATPWNEMGRTRKKTHRIVKTRFGPEFYPFKLLLLHVVVSVCIDFVVVIFCASVCVNAGSI